jgi:hypothetical protein
MIVMAILLYICLLICLLLMFIWCQGACCSRGQAAKDPKQLAVASWRELMNTFNLEYPSICLRALMKGHLTCGVNYEGIHYSGNFWWANCEHVAALDPLFNVLDSFVAEYFLYNTSYHGDNSALLGNNCAFSAFNCNLNLYETECNRPLYRDRLLSYLFAFTDLESFPDTAHGEVNWKKLNTKDRLRVCKLLSKGLMSDRDDGKNKDTTQFRYSEVKSRWNIKKVIDFVRQTST